MHIRYEKYFLFVTLILSLLLGCSSAGSSVAVDSSQMISTGLRNFTSGNYKEAEAGFRNAIKQAVREGNLLNEARAYKYLGNIFSPAAYNQTDQAIAFYDSASVKLELLKISKETAGDTSQYELKIEIANVLSNKALVYQALFEYDKAIFNLEEVLKIDRELDNKEGEILTLGNLGRAYRDEAAVVLGKETQKGKKQIEKSIEYFEQAKALKQSGIISANLSRSFEMLGDMEKALLLTAEAISLFSQEGNTQWSSIMLGNYGKLLLDIAEFNENGTEKNKQLTSARDSLEKAIIGIEKVRGNIGGDAARSTFFDDKVFYYEYLMKACFLLGDKSKLFQVVERAKARSLLDMLYTKDFSSSKQYSPEVKQLIEMEKLLSARIEKLAHVPDSATIYNNLLLEHEALMAQLLEKEPEFASLRQVVPADVKKIQELLPENSKMLEYFLGKTFSAAMLISKDEIKVKQLDFSQYIIEDTIYSLRESFVKYNDDAAKFKRTIMDREREKGNRNWVGIWQEEWAQMVTGDDWQWRLLNLHGLLVGKDFADELKNAEAVFIVPHGILHHLPFAALITSPMNLDFNRKKHLVRPKFWIEEQPLIFLPSAAVLEYLAAKPKNRYDNALIIGNPVYPSPTWAKLPGAEEEAKTISDEFETMTLLIQQEATETYVKEHIGNYDVVHFATHGEFDANALESKVLFTATQEDDGYLTAQEIFDLDLRSSLVVLSACQSGQVGGYLRDRGSAGDDLVGLTRSFLFAGAPRVIATLWFVDDKSTSAVMKQFYVNLLKEKMPVYKALQKAQLDVLNDEDNIDWKHPFYWAPYFLTGVE